jgi:hypothetical protein
MKTYLNFIRKQLSSRVGNYEVLSDGRTVWVNGPAGLVARFCPVSREYVKPSNGISQGSVTDPEESGYLYPLTVPHDPEKGPSETDWADFVFSVQVRYEVQVAPKHKPAYIGA